MSEWWTYGPSDFLMFSPQAYWRLVARYNQAWWPAQAAGLAAAGTLLLLLRRESVAAGQAALLLLAAGWAWTGWAFYARSYAEIFLAAPQAAAACALQALQLVGATLVPGARRHTPAPGWRNAGAVLCSAALLFPLLAPLRGRAWTEAEVFGFMPDPTALASLGVLMAIASLPAWSRGLLAVVPVLALLVGGATRWLLA